MRSLILRLLAILLAIVFAAGAADLVIAKRAGLSPIDRRALEEFQTLADTPQLWRDVDVVSHPFVLMSKDSGFSYLVTNEPVSSPFAEPIPAPAAEGFHVYRLARLYPQLLPTWLLGGNFTTIGHPKRVLGQDSYYVKFGEHSFDVPNSSEHFITFLAHEAFHFYGQENWSMDPGPLGQPDLALLEEELVLFDEIRAETSPSRLRDLAHGLLTIEMRRLAADPEYVAAERWKATVEGTATYVGIKALEIKALTLSCRSGRIKMESWFTFGKRLGRKTRTNTVYPFVLHKLQQNMRQKLSAPATAMNIACPWIIFPAQVGDLLRSAGKLKPQTY